jgi:hypothetical protein
MTTLPRLRSLLPSGLAMATALAKQQTVELRRRHQVQRARARGAAGGRRRERRAACSGAAR